ncbi:Single-stranded DNA-binding protein ssb [Candidatus Izimaplasma bacterium HR1]|jgi:single-strand DNA-binding protein|uniref:single-stranded DNA-binding protein n=1 Tax=Candidatus Izimoplasma sp. HR1 TaxID=1541959 RepID=UPI0004F7480E|nr:Single-stranded DNA-binding protein ssb [Candidatus Izimaplasma bacterium HR1]
MINRTILVGRLTKDPEVRYTSSNIAYARFTLAVNRTFAGPSGEREADFIQCITWRKQAENLARFVRKGSLIGVEGRIQTGSYDDKDGNRKYTTDVVCDSVQFLEPKNQDSQDNSSYAPREPRANNNNSYQERPVERKQSTPSIDVSEDDLPF